MKSHNQLLLLFAIVLFASCEKDEFQTTQLASLRIVNAIVGGTTARLNSITSNINNNSSNAFVVLTGRPDIYVYPVGDSLNPYFHANKTQQVEANEAFSLFLSGIPGAIESLWVKDNYPVHSDSTFGVRFINLTANSIPVNITLATTSTINEFENIGYQQLTEYKTFFANNENQNLTFQVRSSADPNNILASLPVSTSAPRFKNITLVFRGDMTGAVGLTRVNNY
ncbi:MAG: hypothetical protein J7497_13145 [Chitinophagaceae bacterium]|nr:hypothetical protein [Chitinophagaceae bacterium]